MQVRSLSVSTVIGLTLTSFGTTHSGLMLRHLQPRTLLPSGPALTLHAKGGVAVAQAARGGNVIALTVNGPRRAPIRIVDATRLRVTRVIPTGKRDVCAMSFEGRTLVALVAKPWCLGDGPIRYAVLRIDPARGRIVRVTRVDGLRDLRYPVDFAFGDGHAYVARAGAEIDGVDLRTGAVAVHKPRRSLAKGGDFVRLSWLGGHRLGANGTVVDTRTWRRRVLLARGLGSVAGPHDLVAWSHHGASVFTRGGRFRAHVLADEDIQDVQVVGRLAYARVGLATDVVDLVTGKRVSIVPRNWTALPG